MAASMVPSRSSASPLRDSKNSLVTGMCAGCALMTLCAVSLAIAERLTLDLAHAGLPQSGSAEL